MKFQILHIQHFILLQKLSILTFRFLFVLFCFSLFFFFNFYLKTALDITTFNYIFQNNEVLTIPLPHFAPTAFHQAFQGFNILLSFWNIFLQRGKKHFNTTKSTSPALQHELANYIYSGSLLAALW